MSDLEIDFETRSEADIRRVGVYNYFAHPSTRVMIASYCFDDGPIKRWRLGEGVPADILAHIIARGRIWAHNAGFERQAMRWLFKNGFWPEARLEQFHCTAATAAALSLPRDLDGLGRALGLTTTKDKEGHRLMLRMCKPKADGTWYGWDDPGLVERLHAYCDQDVAAERAARKRMIPLSDDMQRFYWISERINDRGVRVDRRSAVAAIALADKAKRLMDVELAEVTKKAVTAGSQVERLKEWAGYRGVTMTSAAKADIEELLELEDIPADVRRAVEIRQEYGKTSIAKIKSMLERASDDGRVRGAFLFHAAGTGRYSSVGAQLHNMPRPRKDFEDAHLDRAELFRAIRTGEPDALRLLYGDKLGRPLYLLSDAVRSFLWARPGRDLVVSDYSSIEGRVAAWVAGEHWKLDAYRKVDDGTGDGIYELAAAGIFGVPVKDVTKQQRQIGKVAELALGYQGGVSAFHSMTKNYMLKLDSAFAPVWASAPAERQEKAVERYEECSERGESTTKVLKREGWLAAELIKVGWRETNPAIKAAWKLLQGAARDAVDMPGVIVRALNLAFVVRQGFLWLRLPSGRCLAYGAPSVRPKVVPWADMTLPEGERETQPTVTVCGVDSTTKQWSRYGLYGGLIFENAVQAIAFDLLKNGIERAEAAGYPVILHVHDEPGAEVPAGFGSVDEFSKIICQLPDWAAGLPISASGWRGKRYRKE